MQAPAVTVVRPPPLPRPPSPSLCSAAITILEQAGAASQPLKCRTKATQCGGTELPAADDYDTVLPQDLPDIRSYHAGLPDKLDYKLFTSIEGPTYHWYFRNLLTLTNWAPCPVLNSSGDAGLPVPKGWKGVRIFDLPQPPNTTETLPFAVLLKVRGQLTG